MKNLSRLFLFLAVSVMAGPLAWAIKMDSGTQDSVIGRIEHVLAGMDTQDSAWTGTSLRLADLLTERARLRFMAEVEANCDNCKGSAADRKKATGIYESILERVKKEDKGTVLFQLAHLYEMAGEISKSERLYDKILNAKPGTYSNEILTHTHLALADIAFDKDNHKKALKHYLIAYNDKTSDARGLTLYRIAWCQFSLGQLDTSIKTLEQLLSSTELLSKNSNSGPVYDASFHADVSRDLATFYLRRKIKTADIEKFKSLLPKDQHKDLFLYFAGEADRLGQKKAAHLIYETYLEEPGLTKEERLSAFVHLTQTKYDMGDAAHANEDFAVAALNIKDGSCSDAAQCAATQKEMRRYVTELHRSKKTSPTMDVLKAYSIYTQTFPEDYEMAMLGAQLASQMKQDKFALTMYRQVGNANSGKYREPAILSEIETAEHIRDPKTSLAERETSYQHYLSVFPQGEKSFSVKYQLAQLSVERKDPSTAAKSFRALALDTSGSLDLRKKSADLALDNLAILKDDKNIQTWSAEFAQALPASASEYRQIGRKATMNQIVQTTNSDKSSHSELQQALQQIQAVDLRGTSDKDRMIHFKNEAILAQKIGDQTALITSLNSLLAIRSLSADDREETLARKVGIYEETFDFVSAYRVAKQMKFPKMKQAEKELRLATLADLANENPRQHYKAALANGLRGKQAAFVSSRLVMLSSSPVKEMKQQKELAQNPRLMEQTLLLVYAKTRDTKGLSPVMKTSSLRHSAAVHFIEKQPFYSEQTAFDIRISRHQLHSGTNAQLKKSLDARIKLLAEAQSQLMKAKHLNDYTAQIMALSTIARENERMAQNILALPLPKGLKKNEQEQYISLLKGKARPFVLSEQIAKQKLNEFWQNGSDLQALLHEQENSLPEVRPLLTRELAILSRLAPSSSIKDQLEHSIQNGVVSQQELTSAIEAVRKDPKDVERLVKLKNLETKFGHPLMATYLESRLAQLQRGNI
jgi:hypothetical protein